MDTTAKLNRLAEKVETVAQDIRHATSAQELERALDNLYRIGADYNRTAQRLGQELEWGE